MSVESLGRILVLLGLVLASVGALFWALARLPFFGSLGNLPGDLVLRRGPVTVFIPLTTMILVSLVLTVVVNLLLRFLRR